MSDVREHEVVFDVDFKRWLTDQEYNDQIHQEAVDGCVALGRKFVEDRNRIVMNAVLGEVVE